MKTLTKNLITASIILATAFITDRAIAEPIEGAFFFIGCVGV